jgi:hypothetical protein
MARPKTSTAERSRDAGPPAPLPVPMTTQGNGTYVTCAACGGMRMPGGPHAATHISHPSLPWPQCEHGAAFMVDCRSNAVPPPCCWRDA